MKIIVKNNDTNLTKNTFRNFLLLDSLLISLFSEMIFNQFCKKTPIVIYCCCLCCIHCWIQLGFVEYFSVTNLNTLVVLCSCLFFSLYIKSIIATDLLLRKKMCLQIALGSMKYAITILVFLVFLNAFIYVFCSMYIVIHIRNKN